MLRIKWVNVLSGLLASVLALCLLWLLGRSVGFSLGVVLLAWCWLRVWDMAYRRVWPSWVRWRDRQAARAYVRMLAYDEMGFVRLSAFWGLVGDVLCPWVLVDDDGGSDVDWLTSWMSEYGADLIENNAGVWGGDR